MPPRHGHGGTSRVPVPVSPGSAPKGTPAGKIQAQTRRKPGSPAIVGPSPPQVVPVSVVSAYTQDLPKPGLQQLSLVQETHFNEIDFRTGNGFIFGTLNIPNEFVWVILDLYFYVVVPATGMNAPPVSLTDYQVSGLLQFELKIDDRDPMRLNSRTLNPYLNVFLFQAIPERSGWPILNQTFGSQRQDIFALYARNRQRINTYCRPTTRSVTPRFPITKVGSVFNGFAMPESEFDSIWHPEYLGEGQGVGKK